MLAALGQASQLRHFADQQRERNALRDLATQEAISGFASGDPGWIARFAQASPGLFQIGLPLVQRGQDRARFDAMRQQYSPDAAPGGAPGPSRGGTTLRGLADVPEQWRGAVAASAQLRGVDPDDLANLLQTEGSNWNPNAVSPRGAVGLGQHMPATASELGIDPRDPHQSIDGAARYLAAQQQRFGRVGGMAAYNAGPGRVERATQNGVINLAALPAETQAYVSRLAGSAAPSGRLPAPRGAGMRLPPPELFARAVDEAALGNEAAQRFVQLWAPFMRQDAREPVETWRPMTAEERQQYNVPAGAAAQISDRGQVRLPGAAQTSVNIDQRAESEEAKAFGRELGSQAAAVFANADKARARLGQLDQFEALMNGFETGRLAPAQRTVAAWAGALGISPETMSRLGINPRASINGDTMSAIANAVTMQFIGSDGIPANNFSDADRKFIQEIGPQLATNPQANRIIIQGMRAAAQRALMQEELWLDARAGGQSFADFRRTWNRWVRENPLFPRPASAAEAAALPDGMYYIDPQNQLMQR